MTMFHRRLLGCVVAALAAVGFMGAGAIGASAVPITSYTCNGGSIPAGTYSSLVVNGPCQVDAGNVRVTGNVAILNGKALYAADGSADASTSNLIVTGNVSVGTNAVLVLGCAPETFPCFNDQGDPPTFSTAHWIGGTLSATNALAVIVHSSTIRGNLAINGGGGGLNNPQVVLFGAPAYATVEDSTIGGNLSIIGWQSCWLGMFRNNVGGNTAFNNNRTADPDGNEMTDNVIAGNLACSGNTPAPQVGDSGGGPNQVTGTTSGQCPVPV
jgi:hypothetical protein